MVIILIVSVFTITTEVIEKVSYYKLPKVQKEFDSFLVYIAVYEKYI